MVISSIPRQSMACGQITKLNKQTKYIASGSGKHPTNLDVIHVINEKRDIASHGMTNQ